ARCGRARVRRRSWGVGRSGRLGPMATHENLLRGGVFNSIGEGRFADEVDVVARLTRPLAILHGAGDQFVSLEYLRALRVGPVRAPCQVVWTRHEPTSSGFAY